MIESDVLQNWTDRVDTELVRYFSAKDLSCNPLDRAMEYTLLAGGKRLRPLLTMIVCDAFGVAPESTLPLALASEFLHTYSLVHDDLPSMDNDDMRRGKPTNHVIFGEANAILAGDALQAEAFQLLATAEFPGWSAQRRLLAIGEFSTAVGRRGMVAGQVMDLGEEGKDVDLERLKLLHARKTGGLLRFCVRLGGHMADVSEPNMAALTRYGDTIGLLFQVVDDLLDEESSTEKLGKTAGKDAARGKATFPKLMGADQAHAYADDLLQESLRAITDLQTTDGLLETVARYIRSRDH